MRLALMRHPGSRSSSVARIDVAITRPHSTRLVLSYAVTGDTGKVRIPPPARPGIADDLWKQTCFEVYLRAPPSELYYEFNFSPSTQWGAYYFTSYRTGMRNAAEVETVPIEVLLTRECYTLQAAVDLDALSALPRIAAWRVGLSAVIEETSGEKSYWALSHPPGPPDFHHADCFVHELSPTETS
jgi:hypothetical protein